jgi:hypothetical protein
VSVRRFRKRPVEIEAVEVGKVVRLAGADWSGLPGWVKESYEKGNLLFTPSEVHVRTLEGWMVGKSGDWLIKEPFPVDDRKIYPCKPEIFEQTYEAVE